MECYKKIIKVAGNVVLFCMLIYLIIIGQKNIGLVKKTAEVLGVTNLGAVGLCIMLIGLFGLLVQLYFYNKKYQ